MSYELSRFDATVINGESPCFTCRFHPTIKHGCELSQPEYPDGCDRYERQPGSDDEVTVCGE